MLDTIPSFTKLSFAKPQKQTKPAKKKRAISPKTAAVYQRAKFLAEEDKLQAALYDALLPLIDRDKSAKALIIELRNAGLRYRLIAKMVGCTYGYVRNLCGELAMTNKRISGK
jgi:hypothetical protein